MANHSDESAQDTPPAVGGGPSISPRTAVSAQAKAFAKENWEDCRPQYKAYPGGPPTKAPPGYPPTKEPPAGNSEAENMPSAKHHMLNHLKQACLLRRLAPLYLSPALIVTAALLNMSRLPRRIVHLCAGTMMRDLRKPHLRLFLSKVLSLIHI